MGLGAHRRTGTRRWSRLCTPSGIGTPHVPGGREQMEEDLMMRVADLMTRSLATVSPDDLVTECVSEMKAGSIRHLPVVDERFRLVGIVSDRDLLLALGRSTDRNVYIRDVMNADVVTVYENDLAADAVRVLLRRKIGALPVVTGEEKQLVGMITETDFLRVAEKSLQNQTGWHGHH